LRFGEQWAGVKYGGGVVSYGHVQEVWKTGR